MSRKIGTECVRSPWIVPGWIVLAGFAVLVFSSSLAHGQDAGTGSTQVPRVAQTPQSTVPWYGHPGYGTVAPPEPGTQDRVPAPAESGLPAPPTPGTEAAPGAAGSAFESALGPVQFAAGGGQTVSIADNVGYIDSAIVRSRFRQRYDSSYDLNTPDRAEFFYAKCGCFSMLPRSNPLFDPRALGPFHPTPKVPIPGHLGLSYPGEPRIDYQELASYLEVAANPETSGFIELPARFLNPTLTKSTYGFSDLNLGFKHAFVATPTPSTRSSSGPTPRPARARRGSGTNHATVEPAFLVFQRITDRLYFNGEFRDWIPVHATNFAGNVLRYGAGLTYNMVLTQHLRVAPVTEFVGWSVLSGHKLVPNPNFTATSDPGSAGLVQSAAGDTIVNAKFGLRIGLGNYDAAGGGSLLNDRHSFYVGYGRALTGDHWYQDTVRVEYNYLF